MAAANHDHGSFALAAQSKTGDWNTASLRTFCDFLRYRHHPCVGYNNKRGLLAAGLMLFAGAIELAQIFAPGRHARLGDFIVDALAASVGVGLSMLAVNFTVYRGRL